MPDKQPMTDRQIVDRIREIAYEIVGPNEKLKKEAEDLYDQIMTERARREASGYFEMLQMAYTLPPEARTSR